jgi:fido (protein-threonine AMPylation protein)
MRRHARSCPEWNDAARDDDKYKERLLAQYAATIRMIVDPASGPPNPVRPMLDRWHRAIFNGLPAVDYYAGNMRGIYPDMPCLAANVEVGGVRGSEFAQVAADVEKLDKIVETFMAETEKRIDAGWEGPPLVDFIIECTAIVVARFIQIHPYLNGNGRISRLIANALLFRFGLGINNVRFDPRPEAPYSTASAYAMTGRADWMKVFLRRAVAATAA